MRAESLRRGPTGQLNVLVGFDRSLQRGIWILGLRLRRLKKRRMMG